MQTLFSRRVCYFFYLRVMGWQSEWVVPLRRFLMSKMLGSSVESLIVRPDVQIFGWRNLRIGKHVSLNHRCFISAIGGLEIGDYVSVAHDVSILTTEHQFEDPTTPIKYQPTRSLPVRIGSNVWIGAKVTILAGVTIADGSVVGAGSVVTKSIDEPNSIWAGVPARFIKPRLRV